MNPVLPEPFLAVPLAHRGLHDVADGRPENSRAAIRAAIAGGYGVEIDVQLSCDNVAMVFHDYDLGRLTAARGPVRAQTAEALGAITLTGGAEGIPTLSEILAEVAGRVPLLIEIKDQDGAMGRDIGVLEAEVARALSAYPGPVAVMSFNPHSVAAFAMQAPGIARGLVTCGYDSAEWPLNAVACDHLREIPDFGRVGAGFISHDHRDLDRPRVQALRAQAVPILCWTIRSAAEAQTAFDAGADNITFERYLPHDDG